MSSTDPTALGRVMFYTPPPLSKKTKIIIIILVLLVHLLFLLPFLNTEFSFLPKSPLEQKVKELHKKVHKIKDQQPEEWATLKSQAMQMSAPVILVDSAVAEAMADKDADSDKDEEEKNNEKIKKEKPKNPESKTADTDNIEDVADKDIPQPTLIDIPEKDGTHPIRQTQEEKPAELNAKSQTQPKPRRQTNTKKRPHQSAVTNPRTQQKPPLSLAQLAQGFVDHMQHEGDYTIAMSGSNSAKATESQLKIGRFLQRIIGSIQTSWRANTKKYPLTHAVIVSMHFTIVINKDGSLNKVHFDKSSGDLRIDNYIRLIIQDASLSFPSIPDYMGHHVCSIRCMLDDIKLPDGPPGYTIRQ